MKKKKELTTDAVEILRRCYGNNLWRKFCRWWYRQILREEKETYNEGYADGHNIGYDEGHEAGWLAARNFPEGRPLQ